MGKGLLLLMKELLLDFVCSKRPRICGSIICVRSGRMYIIALEGLLGLKGPWIHPNFFGPSDGIVT